MKTHKCIPFIFGFFISFSALAQSDKDPVLLSIAGKNVSKSEFEKIYNKNNSKDAGTDTKSLQDYVELFINYKLKVKEAEELRLDTGKNFKTELTGYRKQLAQPYMQDKESSDLLVREAYERMKTDVRASHILLKVPQDAAPKDSLKTYNRIMKIREALLKGADFAKMARDSSEDPSAKDNGGDLGFFSALQMVYPFEDAAYKAKTGEITNPVRTRFGYHLIKVTDTRNAPGEVTASHIMVKAGAKAAKEEVEKAKSKIDSIHNLLVAGGNFEDYAKAFSEDAGSAKNGGVLPPFGTGRMVPEFEKAAFELKNKNDFSKPVKTAYGFHIVKLIDRKPIGTFEELQGDIKSKVSKDSRSELSKVFMVNKIKAAYKFQEFPKAKEEMLKLADSTLAEGKWTAEKAAKLNKPLFNLLDKSFTQTDFAKFVAEKQVAKKGTPPELIMGNLYDQFVEETTLNLKESRLEQEFPEYKALMEEYRDGILLFELTDQKVWSKAVKDSAGLKEYFSKNNQKYMWGDRVSASIYTCASEDIMKKAQKLAKKNTPKEEIEKELNASNSKNVQIKDGKFSKGDNEILDKVKWEVGFTTVENKPDNVVFVHIKEVLKPQPKLLEEARGLATSDFQAQLEKDWIESLRKKYPVNVNKEVLQNIK